MKHLYTVLLLFVFTICNSQTTNLFDHLTGEDVGGTWEVCQQPTGASVVFDTNTGILQNSSLTCIAGDGEYCLRYIVECPECPGLRDTSEVWLQKCCLEVTCFEDMAITCQGGADGAVGITETFGTPTYTYLWSNGQTTDPAIGLSAGTYTVTVTDANGCTATCEYVLTDAAAPVILAIVPTPDTVICVGETITLSTNITTGTAPFTHLWSTTETTSTIDVTTSGTYSVTVTDTNGCTGTDDITITDGAVDTPVCQTQINTDPFVDGCAVTICEGDGTNDITLSPNGIGSSIAGTSTYLWSNGSNLASITLTDVLAADSGTYSLTVTSTDGCTSTLDFTVTVFDEIDIVCTPTNTTCVGANDGSVTTVVNNGTGPYTYVWSDASTTSDITSLSDGTYTVTVTDANGCTGTCQGVVADGVGITATIAGTLSFCIGGSTTLTASSDGTPPETYVWSTTETTAAIVVSAAGTYTVTVTDANGCTDEESVAVTEEIPPTLVCRSRIIPDAFTNGVCDLAFCEEDGTLDVVFRPDGSGHTIPAGSTYLWNTGLTNAALLLNNVTAASSGTYTITVTDPNGCTATQDFVLDVYDQPEIACTATDETCNNASDGTVTTVVTGGTGPFTYLWDNAETTSDIIGLNDGTYTVTVTDANGCTATCSGTVAAGPNLILNIAGGGDYCDGETALLDATPFNGTGPYTYIWSTGATTEDINVATSGTYCATVTDTSNGCTDDQCVPVTFNPNPTLACEYNFDNAGFVDGCTFQLCEEDGTHDIILSPSGTGNNIPGGSTYLWTGGTTGSTLSLLNLTAANSGTYTVTVTESLNGCTAEISFTLDVYDQPEITCTAVATTCDGADDGQVTTAVTGGTGPYTYIWSNAETTSDITGLAPSTYTVTVTDANGCTDTCSGEVVDGAGITADVIVDVDICDGQTTAAIANSDGTGPETFLWSTGETINPIFINTTGSYSVTVTDANGCTDDHSFSVTIFPVPVLVCETQLDGAPFVDGCTIEVCEDDGLHDIVLSPDGTGSSIPAGSTYSWTGGSTNPTLTLNNVTAASSGIYSVTVNAPNDCDETIDFTVTVHPSIDITCNGNDTSCPGVFDGTITTSVTGGTPTFTYAWSNGQTTANATGLAPGTYTVTVTDSEGCTATCSETVAEGVGLNVTITGNTEYCASDGSTIVAANSSNGTGPFTYLWSDGGTATTNNLSDGTYTVTVTDNIGCTGTADVTIVENPDPFGSCTPFDGQCGALGFINFAPTGGTPPYTYLWSHGPTTQDASNLSNGTYNVTLTDANGCTFSCGASITNEPAVTVSCNGTNVDCFGDTDGTATATVSSGTAPFTYNWSNGGSTATITNLPSGTYTVTVTDANGCNDVCSYSVTSPPQLTVTTSCS